MKCVHGLKKVVEGISHREGISETLRYLSKSMHGYIRPTDNSLHRKNSVTNILIPGFVSTAETMKPIGDSYIAKGENVVYAENPTYMNFESVKTRVESIEREIHFILSLYPETTIHLIGHSMGGRICLELGERLQDLIEKMTIISGACREVDHAKHFGFIPSLRDLSRSPIAQVTEKVKTTIFVALHDSLISRDSQKPIDQKNATIIEFPTNHIEILSPKWAEEILKGA